MSASYSSKPLLSIPSLLLLCLIFGCGLLAHSTDNSLFGPISPTDYLSGCFDPETHPLFVKISEYGIPGNRVHYLRRETAEALKNMYDAMKKDMPAVKFWVQSSTRNWNTQKSIWTRRWHEIAMREKKAKASDIVAAILRSSSMPGTSRHHWGTDFDINILKNDYYRKGNGALVYQWLKKHAAAFGFCQPYTAGRSAGYVEERWHWSYMPLAMVYQKKWNELFSKHPDSILQGDGFIGDRTAVAIAPVYVNSIDASCFQGDAQEQSE